MSSYQSKGSTIKHLPLLWNSTLNAKNDNTFAGVHPHVSTSRQTTILNSDSALSLSCWENKGKERAAELDFFFPVYDSTTAIALILIWEIRRRKLISKSLFSKRSHYKISDFAYLHWFYVHLHRKTTFRDSLRGEKLALTLAVSHLFNRNWPRNTVNVVKPQVN